MPLPDRQGEPRCHDCDNLTSAGGPGYKAVVFDIGGVVVHSPLEGIRIYERQHAIPENYINGPSGAFQRLERNELTLQAFYPLFTADLNRNPRHAPSYIAYLDSKGTPASPALRSQLTEGYAIDGRDLFECMMREAERVQEPVVDAIRRIRSTGRYTLAALTNNYKSSGREDGPPGVPSEKEADLRAMFDHYIESSVVGLRKPDRKFFLHACGVLGVRPEECVFLDDIGVNLKAAKDLGFRTIR
ncbi:hypothetical protein HK101_009854 [Irineochytrium annulatum]|nr:hypothetical protein HK101_009854 [Irineochytrium annulatum]